VKRCRFILLAALAGLASLYAGVRLATVRQVPPVHPLTGRQIAGIATDAAWLDRGSREQEEAPEAALELIGIRRGMVIGDVGAGSGYMTMRMARMVGPGGTVFANDIQPGMLRIVQEKASREGLSNIRIVLGTDTDARLPDNALDLAILVDVYHELWHPQEMLRSIRRSLKAGGELVLVEYRKEDASIPIAPAHRMSIAEARAEVEAEGYTFDRVIPGLPRQHIIVFRR